MIDHSPELIGIGSPLTDLLLRVDDDFIANHAGGDKGGMRLVEADTIAEMLSWAGKDALRAPGGAAANTTVGAANLGVRSAFVGCVGNDELGAFYRENLLRQGCGDRLITVDAPSGRVLSLITPDAQRTMRSCLGAAAQLSSAHITDATFAGASVAVVEGYLLFQHEVARAVIDAAHRAGAAVALDFASFEVVHANREVIRELLPKVALAFVNEDEATAWHEAGPEAALHDLSGRVGTVAVKLGKDGAMVAQGARRVRVPAEPVEAVDTTGAGDCWAAGFLAAWLRGLDLERCARTAARAGAAAVSTMGAQPSREAWLSVKGYLDAWS